MFRLLYLTLVLDKFYRIHLILIDLGRTRPVEHLLEEHHFIEDFLLKMENDYYEHIKAITTSTEMKEEYKQLKSLHSRLNGIRLLR
ncbi:hypothetical protein ABS768_04460 [Flavobacterium sp. ST-75]|uniref:Uncharacterized protein n=1 Tax=Flavobacterium rhizophilum TaxID=3163296 RepID=A0ABW8Y9Q8_9FLAO